MIIGHAEVIISPITRGFEAKLRKDIQSISGAIGGQTGSNLGQSFAQGWRAATGNIFNKFMGGLEGVSAEATAAKERFQSLVRVGYVVQGVIGILVGGISSLVASLGTLVGILGRAAPAVSVLGSAFATLGVAMITAKMAFGQIGSAVAAATKQNSGLGKSIAEIREEFQQLQFQAEEAALSEGRAALNLEAALENLRRTADLPPNSAARREAQLAYEEAELAYRRAKDRTQDLNAEVAKGPEALNKAAGQDPFADLNEYQRTFAEYLVSLKPKIDALRLELSKAFLPPLQGAVEILEERLYPILMRELPKVAGNTGEALQDMFDNIDYSKIEKMLSLMTEDLGGAEGTSNLDKMGELFGNILDILLQIVNAASPLLNDFLTFLVDKTESWKTTLEDMDLVGWFDESGEYAGGLGEIIGNIFRGLGNLIGLTTGPGSAGEDMLTWLKDATKSFENMFAEDPDAGKQYFKDAFANAQSVMSSIGALISEILKLADNPNIKETFDKLKEGAPDLGELLGKLVDAGPSFAQLIETITEIANRLTDDNQMSAFFDTLNKGAEGFRDFLDTDLAKKFFDNLGPIFATFSALGVIFDVVRFALLTVGGYILFFFGDNSPFGKLKGMFDGKKDPFTKMAGALSKAKGPLGPLLRLLGGAGGGGLFAIFLLLIAKAVEFYNSIEGFRQMVDNVFGEIGKSFEDLFDELNRFFSILFGGEGEGGGLLGAFDPLIQVILEVLIPIFGYMLSTVIDTVTMIISWFNNLFEGVSPGISDFIDGVMLLFSGDLEGGMEKIGEGIGNIVLGIVQFFINSIIDLINFGIKNINHLIGIITDSDFANWLSETLGINMKGFRIAELEHVDLLGTGTKARTAAGASSSDRALVNRFQNSAAYTQFESERQANLAAANQRTNTAAMGGITQNIYPSAGMNERELGYVAGREIAWQVGKGYGG